MRSPPVRQTSPTLRYVDPTPLHPMLITPEPTHPRLEPARPIQPSPNRTEAKGPFPFLSLSREARTILKVSLTEWICCVALCCVVLRGVVDSTVQYSPRLSRSGAGSALRWGRFLAQLSLWEYQGLFSWYEMGMRWRSGRALAQELDDGMECHR